MEVEASQVIDRPVSDVFRWYADDHVQNHPRWDPDLELEKITEGPIGEGTVIRRESVRNGTHIEGTMEVVEYEPEEAFGLLIKEGGYEMPGRATFEELGPSKTRITISVEISDSTDKDSVQSLLEGSAQTVKELIESDL